MKMDHHIEIWEPERPQEIETEEKSVITKAEEGTWGSKSKLESEGNIS